MRRAFLLSLVIYALILIGLLARTGLVPHADSATEHGGAVLALALLFVTYLVASLLSAPRDVGLEITRALSAERVGADMPVEVTLQVANTGSSLEEVLVQDNTPPDLTICDGSPRHVLRLARGQTVTWTYTVRGPRGYYAFSSARLKASDPLGLVSHEQTLTLGSAARLLVLPPVLRLKSVAIRPRRTRVYSGLIPARVGGTGTDFFGVREYQAGDPPHWINWRATAHHPDTLFSNEFEQERVTDIGIVLDGRRRANLCGVGRALQRRSLPDEGHPHHTIFEYSTLAAAALADAFLTQGNRVSLLLYGRYLQWTLPGYGKVQRERILRTLAQAQMGDSEIFADLDHIPAQLLPAHSQVVLVSPLLPGDSPLLSERTDDVEVLIRLRARGYQVMIVSPDPVAFEIALLRADPNLGRHKAGLSHVELAARIVQIERSLMLQRLRRAGIQVINWDVATPFEQTVHSRLGRPPTWLQAVGGSP